MSATDACSDLILVAIVELMEDALPGVTARILPADPTSHVRNVQLEQIGLDIAALARSLQVLARRPEDDTPS